MNVRTGPSHLDRTLISVRRAFGGAVSRNRVRRRLKSVLRDVFPQGHPGKLLFISVADGAGNASYAQLRDELIFALRTLHLLEP
jgi:ribonuclease P protein component